MASTELGCGDAAPGCANGLPSRFKSAKYNPAIARRQTAAMEAAKTNFFFGRLLEAEGAGRVCGEDNRCATSAADCGRRAGSLARHAAIASSQTGGRSAGSMLNSLRRSVIDGAIRSWIWRSILPE